MQSGCLRRFFRDVSFRVRSDPVNRRQFGASPPLLTIRSALADSAVFGGRRWEANEREGNSKLHFGGDCAIEHAPDGR